MCSSVAQFIKERGDAKAFAEKVNVDPGAVRLWKHRGIIPRRAWPVIVKAFDGEITLDDLFRLEAGQSAQRSVKRGRAA